MLLDVVQHSQPSGCDDRVLRIGIASHERRAVGAQRIDDLVTSHEH